MGSYAWGKPVNIGKTVLVSPERRKVMELRLYKKYIGTKVEALEDIKRQDGLIIKEGSIGIFTGIQGRYPKRANFKFNKDKVIIDEYDVPQLLKAVEDTNAPVAKYQRAIVKALSRKYSTLLTQDLKSLKESEYRRGLLESIAFALEIVDKLAAQHQTTRKEGIKEKNHE